MLGREPVRLNTPAMDENASPTPVVPTGATGDLPTFRRPKREDALDFAQAAFLAAERVDLGTLATQLSVGRSTLHRWFGTREQLLEYVLVQLTRQLSASAQLDLGKDAENRLIEFTRRMIRATVQVEAVRGFVTREPQLALRILTGRQGAVHHAIVDEIMGVIGDDAATELEERVNVAVQVGTTLQWATFAVGDEPDVEYILGVVVKLIAAG
jgi:hypothetical protein